ncbi:MAG TPA: formylglycine-generating enzyme family protein [Stenotrophobium sp.]|nr:formylglycine-generating enzyme family protein [Stenotrophobium sp.]
MIFRGLLLLALAIATTAHADAKPAQDGKAATIAAVAPSCRASTKRLASGIVVFRDCGIAPQMIALRGGHYRMGDLAGDGQPYERPVHEVRTQPFALGRFEVTHAEWQACVHDGGCSQPHEASDDAHARYPVAGVSWIQAQAYVDWLAARTGKPYRLPSEAEWEYAARAGSEERYPWGSYDPDPCAHVNLLDASGRRGHPERYWAEKCDDHYAAAAPVGSFPANAWGFHDMLGNVWEWVADCWHADYRGAPGDGSAWFSAACRKHVNRGGGWGNNLHALRLSSRDADPGDAYDAGLGFRVARALTHDELPQAVAVAPDTPPPPVPVFLTRAQSRALARTAPPPVPVAPPPPPATSLALVRQFEVHVTVNGRQSWQNGLQHTQGNTRQDYVLSTRLRSDGILYGDNLLDPDQTRRLAIKQQFLAREGLIRLKALNGGRLPRNAAELSALTAKISSGTPDCMNETQCNREEGERLAALQALQDNPAEDLDALIAAPATGEAARWLYFFGYAGCPNRIHIASDTHIAGERAYDRRKRNLLPWSLDRSADSDGSAADKTALCQRYTATVNIRTGEVDLENLYIPSPAGVTVRTLNGSAERIEENLPVAAEMMAWASARLHHASEILHAADTLTANAPFDGDYTVLGRFDGKLDVTLDWSFEPVAGAPLASIPPATATDPP